MPWARIQMTKVKKIGNVAIKSFMSFSDDKILKYSAALAYTTVFSMGPLLIVMIFFASFLFGREATDGEGFLQMKQFIERDAASQLQTMIQNASVISKKTFAAILGVV